MILLQVKRQYSVIDTWINLDKINVIVKSLGDKEGWSVVMDNGICYDITDKSFNDIQKVLG